MITRYILLAKDSAKQKEFKVWCKKNPLGFADSDELTFNLGLTRKEALEICRIKGYPVLKLVKVVW